MVIPEQVNDFFGGRVWGKVFDRETSALRSLSHPNIVHFRNAGVDETGTFYLVLDWVDRSLTDLLKAPLWEGWDDLTPLMGAQQSGNEELITLMEAAAHDRDGGGGG